MSRAARLFQPLAAARGLTVHLHANVQTLPALHDRGALGRVLHNLIGNAVKFTEAGEIRLVVSAEPTSVAIKVADTGIGIDAGFLPKLFTEFKQESEGHARSHEGTGLGLAISKRLVELMAGTITVESKKGVGTVFTVTLPRTHSTEGDGATTRMPGVPVAGVPTVS